MFLDWVIIYRSDYDNTTTRICRIIWIQHFYELPSTRKWAFFDFSTAENQGGRSLAKCANSARRRQELHDEIRLAIWGSNDEAALYLVVPMQGVQGISHSLRKWRNSGDRSPCVSWGSMARLWISCLHKITEPLYIVTIPQQPTQLIKIDLKAF